MEEITTILQKFDAVLKFTNLDSTWGAIWNKFHSDIDNTEELKSIIRKLRKDDYLIVYRLNSKETMPKNEEYGWDPEHKMHRSAEGDLLVLQGGYVQQHKNAESEKKKLADLEQRQFDQETRMVNLTRWVAVGAVGLVAWEIFKFFVFEHHWNCH